MSQGYVKKTADGGVQTFFCFFFARFRMSCTVDALHDEALLGSRFYNAFSFGRRSSNLVFFVFWIWFIKMNPFSSLGTTFAISDRTLKLGYYLSNTFAQCTRAFFTHLSAHGQSI
jgi:hypothetical protein